jgi:predicted ATPase/DNA-binding CsgD family transcriptional regulator
MTRGKLPAEVSGFVGRQQELDALATLLRTARLVTVTGPGGVGKTRVALRAAAQAEPEFTDGVCLVELSGLRNAELLPNTVASCLGLPEQDARSALDAITGYLSDRRLLLILDTCEHLVTDCATLADAVLHASARVAVLATSRQPLGLPAEHAYAIGPLTVPPLSRPGGAGHGEALELLAQRASAAVPDFALTPANYAEAVRLCRRLDGLPLAIELAAVRLRAIPLSELTERLDQHFGVLSAGRGILARHQTIEAAIGWSYDLCTQAERLLWERLSVFAGSFDVAAAEEVCGAGALPRGDVLAGLAGLVDKSVVLRTDQDGARYRLLDPVRSFAAARLAARGGQRAQRDRHLAYYLARAQHFDSHYLDFQLEQYRALRQAHADLRAALEYAFSSGDYRSTAARLAISLYTYWGMSGLVREGVYWLGKVIEAAADTSPERAWALIARCYLTSFGGAAASARADGEAGIAMAEVLGDAQIYASGHQYLHMALTFGGWLDEAAAIASVAAERLADLGSTSGLMGLDAQLGYMYLLMGDIDAARARCARGLARVPPGSSERWTSSYLHLVSAFAMALAGDYGPATEAAIRALLMKRDIDDSVGIAYCLSVLAWIAVGQERYERATWLLGAAEPLWQRAGSRLSGDAVMEVFQQRAVEQVQAALGRHRFAAAWQEGAAEAADEIIALAISGADSVAHVGGGLGLSGAGLTGTELSGAGLTGREREVVALVADGLSNRVIAERLVISKRTVDAHLEHIFAKLGISSRVHVATWYRAGQGEGSGSH